MKRNFKKIICLLICTLFISALLSIVASADTGPKPSVRITFENMGDELCFGTLLSKQKSTGPASVWDGNEEYAQHNGNERYAYLDITEDIWRAFVEYEDTDGYYFLQETWKVNETKELAWTYYPPDSFKILLYYPETDKFLVSDICERYAFDSYYTVDIASLDAQDTGIGSVDYNEDLSNDDRLNAHRSYQWQQELLSLAARIIITIAIEMGVALLFGFRGKKALLLLAAVNTVTQIALNVLLNIINFSSGQAAFVAGYILLELAVFVGEAVLYTVLTKKLTDKVKPTWFYMVYALVANAVSFGVGLVIANILPGIF
ncbi:MAG: hypothetical protein IJX74_04030 [Clostridia bacterium]|nr:hypothetical protein [Clostridia bacterium]